MAVKITTKSTKTKVLFINRLETVKYNKSLTTNRPKTNPETAEKSFSSQMLILNH